MSFKLRSTISVYEYPQSGSNAEGINHVVLSRERLLHPGEKIPVSGDITYDEEAKGGWIKAKGEIRVIDGEALGIRWRPSFSETLLKFEDAYHSEPKFHEVFTLADKARTESLIEKMLRRVESIKNVERRTELIYEPSCANV